MTPTQALAELVALIDKPKPVGITHSVKHFSEWSRALANARAALAQADGWVMVPKALLENPPRHRYWGAGESDCPKDIKAPNGELHTLRCKVCGEDSPRTNICLKALIAAAPKEPTP